MNSAEIRILLSDFTFEQFTPPFIDIYYEQQENPKPHARFSIRFKCRKEKKKELFLLVGILHVGDYSQFSQAFNILQGFRMSVSFRKET